MWRAEYTILSRSAKSHRQGHIDKVKREISWLIQFEKFTDIDSGSLNADLVKSHPLPAFTHKGQIRDTMTSQQQCSRFLYGALCVPLADTGEGGALVEA